MTITTLFQLPVNNETIKVLKGQKDFKRNRGLYEAIIKGIQSSEGDMEAIYVNAMKTK